MDAKGPLLQHLLDDKKEKCIFPENRIRDGSRGLCLETPLVLLGGLSRSRDSVHWGDERCGGGGVGRNCTLIGTLVPFTSHSSNSGMVAWNVQETRKDLSDSPISSLRLRSELRLY